MTIDANLKLAGVEGESTHKDHKGEIQVLSWSWGLTQSSKPPAAAGAGRGLRNRN